MKQNKKPAKPLNPHLADLIGDFIMSDRDRSRFAAVKQFVAGSSLRRVVSVSALSLIAVTGFLTYVAYGTSFHAGKINASQTTINTSNSDNQLMTIVSKKEAAYGFTIVYSADKSQRFTLADAGISINKQASVAQIRQTVRHLGWQRFAWWQATEVPLVMSKDNRKLAAFEAAHIAKVNQPATDAALSVKDGKAVISEGSNGATYQIVGGNKQLVRAATSLKPLKTKLEPAVVKPRITASDLKNAANKVNDITGHSVSFAIGSRTVIVTPAEIGNWLDIQTVPAEKTADVTVNSGKVQAYVDKISASSIYPAKAQISTTSDSGDINVIAAGRNGSTIANKAAVAKAVTNQLLQPDAVITAKLDVVEDAYKTINAADYPKWLVADVTTKRMYAYEHNRLVRSFLISAGAPKTPTVLGTYKMYSKLPLRTMRGANADGSRYVQENVKYVNYFYKDYAVHGNYWRPTSYFGNVNSSHGCIGITDSDAEWIYNWAPIGTTVITHN